MAAKRGRKRAPKGSVQPRVRGGLISLRWTYQGKPESLPTGQRDNPEGRMIAAGIAGRIQDDIAFQRYDESKDRYRPQGAARKPLSAPKEMIEPFLAWQRSQGLTERTLTDNYRPALKLLQRFDGMPSEGDVRALMSQASKSRSAYTLNRYLGYWRALGKWAVKFGHWPENPFASAARLKQQRPDRSKKRPFAKGEAERILKAAGSRSAWAHYHDMIFLMLSLGCRPGEVIELRWKDVDLKNKTITIARQAARVPGQSALEVKATKGQNVRTLPLVASVVVTLKARKPKQCRLSSLIFPAPKGGHLDTSNFAQRVWRPILEAAEVDHRSPNACRHTFLSNLIELGATLPQAARAAGHNDCRMVAQVYGHAITDPVMPEL